jgi:5-methyltetrahydrofolate--homocysteine methyltransferase
MRLRQIHLAPIGPTWPSTGIEDRIYELAFAGGKIAREAADAASTPDKPRFVLGSLGPGTKLAKPGTHNIFTSQRRIFHRFERLS